LLAAGVKDLEAMRQSVFEVEPSGIQNVVASTTELMFLSENQECGKHESVSCPADLIPYRTIAGEQ
jgi:hypothetical protein